MPIHAVHHRVPGWKERRGAVLHTPRLQFLGRLVQVLVLSGCQVFMLPPPAVGPPIYRTSRFVVSACVGNLAHFLAPSKPLRGRSLVGETETISAPGARSIRCRCRDSHARGARCSALDACGTPAGRVSARPCVLDTPAGRATKLQKAATAVSEPGGQSCDRVVLSLA